MIVADVLADGHVDDATAGIALIEAVAIAWLPGPAGTRWRVAKLSVEEPDAAEPARPDLWGARVSNDPGLPDRGMVPPTTPTTRIATAATRGFPFSPGLRFGLLFPRRLVIR